MINRYIVTGNRHAAAVVDTHTGFCWHDIIEKDDAVAIAADYNRVWRKKSTGVCPAACGACRKCWKFDWQRFRAQIRSKLA